MTNVYSPLPIVEVKPARDLNDAALVQTLIELYARSGGYPDSKILHDRWVELKKETDSRFIGLREEVSRLSKELKDMTIWKDIKDSTATTFMEQVKKLQEKVEMLRACPAHQDTAKGLDPLCPICLLREVNQLKFKVRDDQKVIKALREALHRLYVVTGNIQGDIMADVLKQADKALKAT